MSEWFTTFGFDEVELPEARGRLWVGAFPTDADDVAELARAGITSVLALCEDCEYAPGQRLELEAAYREHDIVEARVTSEDFAALADSTIETAAGQTLEWLGDSRRVYLHCRAGMQRSATIATAVITRLEDGSVLDALSRLRRARPVCDPLPGQMACLERWHRQAA